MKFYINGDGSYLGIVDVGTFKGYVGPNWAEDPKLLEPHFVEQMQNYSGLYWDSNLEASWVVEVVLEKVDKQGFREITGSLKVTNKQVAILNYDSLTMIAQFEDQTIDKHIANNTFDLDNGSYNLRVIQLKDPASNFPDGENTDFIVEITKTENLLPALQTVPWSKLQ